MSIGATSPGTNLNRLIDSYGLPDQVGDIYGAALDAVLGNQPGMIRNLVDAFTPISTAQLDRAAAGLAPAGFAEKPSAQFPKQLQTCSQTYHSREQIIKGSILGPGMDRSLGAAIEKEIMADPRVRASWEAKLGGRIVYDGKADGTITVCRAIKHQPAVQPGQNQRVISDLIGRTYQRPMMDQAIAGLSSFLQNSSAATGTSAPAGSSSSDPANGANDPSAILRDPSLSFEEKLSLFLFAFMDNQQKEINDKLAKMDNSAKGQTDGSKSKSGGGLLGGLLGGKGSLGGAVIGGILGAPLGPVGSFAGAAVLGGKEGFSQYMGIGGALLGGYYGGPVGAQLGQQLGTEFGAVGGEMARSAAQDVAGKFFGGKSAGSGGAAATSPADQQKSDQIEMMKLQQAIEQMNKMFSLVDNMLKSMNDVVRQGPIASIRG